MAVGILAKASTGIPGLDDATGGGIPRGRTTLVTGGPGSGKTIFALQTLLAGVESGEPGILVAFEEHSAAIQANAASFAWNLRAARKSLSFVDAQISPDTIVSGDFDLEGLLASLAAKVKETGARRIAFDSIDVLMELLGNSAAAARELRRLHAWLLEQRITAIITAKSAVRDGVEVPATERLEFMVDCAISLRHEVNDGVSHRSVRVLKYRGSSFAENASPMVIARNGLEVASPVSRPLDPKLVFTQRVSSGVAGLDEMLNGGYYRGSSILVTGSPGTAKSTLCGTFAEAACARGESTLFVSFDSEGQEIVRNLASVGIRLGKFMKEGILTMHSTRGNASSAEVHLLAITCLARDHKARCIVIDPVSAMGKAGNELAGFGVVERLIDWAKQRGITVLCTSLLSSAEPNVESTRMQISTIADTWLHLSYVINAGERNRAITIVKARGTAHSNQVRELVLSNDGVSLAEVYTAEGQVLMGAMRWQKERADRLAREHAQQDLTRRRELLRLDRDELAARVTALQKQMTNKDVELRALEAAQAEVAASEVRREGVMRELRGSKPKPPESRRAKPKGRR